MELKSKLLTAAAVLALVAGASTLPAAANDSDYGQYRYTSENPNRFAPAGLPADEAHRSAGDEVIERPQFR